MTAPLTPREELPRTRSLFNRFSVHEIPDAEEQARMLTEHAIKLEDALAAKTAECERLRVLLMEVLPLLRDEWDGTRETSSGNRLIARIAAVLGTGEQNGN
jgi:hypothetical protein